MGLYLLSGNKKKWPKDGALPSNKSDNQYKSSDRPEDVIKIKCFSCHVGS